MKLHPISMDLRISRLLKTNTQTSCQIFYAYESELNHADLDVTDIVLLPR